MTASSQIQSFFDFINERHRIYSKRLGGLPSQWTEDPILQKYKFCNVYRELDRGSVYYIQYFTKNHFDDVLFKTIAYRLLNNYKFFEAHGMPNLKNFCPNGASEYEKALLGYRLDGKTLFNPAYRIYGTFGRGTAIESYLKSLLDAAEQNDSLEYKLKQSKTLEEAWQALQSVYKIGKFIAYEIVCDLMYIKYLPFTENDFTNAGPGALWGLKIIYGILTKSPANYIEDLRRIQQDYLPADYPGPPLTLRSIEHSLCEYRKYVNLKNKTGLGRLFIPSLPLT